MWIPQGGVVEVALGRWPCNIGAAGKPADKNNHCNYLFCYHGTLWNAMFRRGRPVTGMYSLFGRRFCSIFRSSPLSRFGRRSARRYHPLETIEKFQRISWRGAHPRTMFREVAVWGAFALPAAFREGKLCKEHDPP